ncbi:hypothetical protein [Burkholderia catarinensis]|uniref:hypothetical protein n=1 Tax=Burkholderia catarinensis TaxID=1108140 RepID=UPI0010085E95|nr:hypothetical protein [Burkholderia catarinensis]
MKAIIKSKQGMRIRPERGQVTKDGIAIAAEVGKDGEDGYDPSPEIRAMSDAVAGKRAKILSRISPAGRSGGACHGVPCFPPAPTYGVDEAARHEICGNFASTRLALCARGRKMAVFRFQRRCRSTLKAESDEDVALIGNIACLP